MFNIFKWWMFYCHVSFGGGKLVAVDALMIFGCI